MGVFWTTRLYHGRLLSLAAYNRIRERTPQDFLQQVADERFVLHAPGRCLDVGFMDPVLSEHAKESGNVSLEHVQSCIEKYPEWSRTTADQLRLVEDLVKAAADDPSAAPGIYVCEVESCTLVDPTLHPWEGVRVRYNLRVT